MYQQKKEASLTEASVIALAAGYMAAILFPGCYPVAAAMMFGGACGLVYKLKTFSKFDKVFKNLGLGKGDSYPIKKRSERKDGYTLYEFTLPAGISTDDIEKHKQAIQQKIGREMSIEYGYKNILIRVYNDSMKHFYQYETVEIPGAVGLPIGYDHTGRMVGVDLSKDEPHLLIAGESGSGKSTTLRAIVTNLIMTKDVDLYLIDLKRGAEFNLFRKCEKVRGFARTEEEALVLLTEISEEVDRRYEVFFASDCINIQQYNKDHTPYRFWVVVVDEFADMMYDRDSIKLVEGLAAKARACGIHLIISTQRPDARVLSGRIKANVPLILGLKTSNELNSRIIIDDSGLEKLRGKGHGVFKHGRLDEVQCPFLTPERAQELLRPKQAAEPVKLPAKRKKSPFDVFGGA